MCDKSDPETRSDLVYTASMQITVFGASGKVGSLVVEQALRRGYRVVAFVHNHSLFAPSGKLSIRKGDIYNAPDVVAALKGSDAVVSCLSSWGTPGKDVLTSAMRTIIPAMVEQKIKRIVTLTGSGANEPGNNPSVSYKLMLQVLAPFPAGKVFCDGEDHMKLLADSNLRWTTIRSPVMNNRGTDGYELNLKAGSPLTTIKRAAVATALLDQIDAANFLHQAPIIHRV
jgi:putative NADH-flavin reductase